MKAMIQVFQKVFALEFYRSNASFFLLILGLAGGFMRSYDHIVLAEFFIASYVLLLIPLLVWSLYTIKVIRFNLEVLSRSENEFVYAASLLSTRERWIVGMQTLAAQLIPVFLYASFLILMAIKHQMIVTVVLVIMSCLALLILSTAHLIYTLLHPHVQKNRWALTRYVNTTFSKPFLLFFPEWIMRRETVMVLGTKLFTCALLYGVEQLYASDSYDLRLLGMGVVVAFCANVNIVSEMHRFDNLHFSILRNLPIPFSKRLLYFLLTMILLTLPEAGIIWKNFPQQYGYTDLLSVLIFGWSIPLKLYGSFYLRDSSQERQTTIVFFTSMIMVVLVLFDVPIIVLAAINGLIGFTLWRKFYYSFEYRNGVGGRS